MYANGMYIKVSKNQDGYLDVPMIIKECEQTNDNH